MQSQLNQAARGMAPFVAAAHRQPERHEEWDALCQATLRIMWQTAPAGAGTGVCSGGLPRFAVPSSQDGSQPSGVEKAIAILRRHLASCVGRLVDLEPCIRLYLFFTLRSQVSAAVRLGIIGPLEGQAVQQRSASYAESMVSLALSIPSEDSAQPRRCSISCRGRMTVCIRDCFKVRASFRLVYLRTGVNP